ncbi:hypothetical protein GALLN_00040 [Gallionellaceae bacterium]|nr:hypothetical protein GALLN_00040 [Gallionellaceae bacterium]
MNGWISAQAHIGAADVKPRSGGRSQNLLEQLKEVVR